MQLLRYIHIRFRVPGLKRCFRFRLMVHLAHYSLSYKTRGAQIVTIAQVCYLHSPIRWKSLKAFRSQHKYITTYSYHGNYDQCAITIWRNTGITSPHKNRIYKNFTTFQLLLSPEIKLNYRLSHKGQIGHVGNRTIFAELNMADFRLTNYIISM